MITRGDNNLILNDILRQLIAIRELLRQLNEAIRHVKEELK